MYKSILNRWCTLVAFCMMWTIPMLHTENIAAGDAAHIIRSLNEDCCLIVTDDEVGKLDTLRNENIYQYKDIIIVEYENEEDCQSAYDELVEAGIDVETNDFFEISGRESEIVWTGLNEKAKDYKLVPVVDAGITIAVIDTGYDLASFGNDRIINPVDLKGNGNVQDSHGHGTAISRLIIDNTNNGVYVMPVKITDTNGRCSVLDMYMAINYCIEKKVDIINISMSAFRAVEGELINTAIKEATANNIAVVVSAGNGGSDVSDYSPGNCEEAITVSACDANYKLTAYSNFGDTIDFCAYGDLSDGKSGTSISAAQISVVLAELMIMNPGLSVQQYEHMLRDAALKNGQKEKSRELGYGIITLDGLDALFASKPCESSILLNSNCLSMDISSFNNLIKTTPYSTIRKYLLNLTEDERKELLRRETYLSNSQTNFLVAENITSDENSAVITTYESLYEYLMKNEFETAWHCSDSIKDGYYFLTYVDETNNKEITQKIQVRLSGLPTVEANTKGSITLIDDMAPANGEMGYIIEKVSITSALEKNYIYIAVSARLNLGKANHYSLRYGKDEDSYDPINGGGGGITNIMDKKSVGCTGNSATIDYVNMQVGFHNLGISVTGGDRDTGKHIRMIVYGKKNENTCVYSSDNGIENGKREVQCKACSAPSKTEYLHCVYVKKMLADGTYLDDISSEYCKKMNMDGTDFVDKYDGNYYEKGIRTDRFTQNFDKSVYRDATLDTFVTDAHAEEHTVLVSRKKYIIEFDGNLFTKGSMKRLSLYFGQREALRTNAYARKYNLEFFPNEGEFSDKAESRTQTIKFKFIGWNTKADGTGVSFEDNQEVKDVLVAGSNEKIEERAHGEIITLYAQWKIVNASLPKDIGRKGYSFSGWSEDRGGENPVMKLVPDKDMELYAAWTPNIYKISLNARLNEAKPKEEGTKEIFERFADNYYKDKDGTVIFDEGIDIPQKTSREKIEYKKVVKKSDTGNVLEVKSVGLNLERSWMFTGYYTDETIEGYLFIDENGALIDNIGEAGKYKYFTDDTEVYARWKKKSYILYVSNLADNDIMTEKDLTLPEMIEIREGEKLVIEMEEPVVEEQSLRSLYRFKGWSTDVYGNNMVLDTVSKQKWEVDSTDDIVLYAIWETSLEIEYNGNEQTVGENYIQTGNSIYSTIEIIDNTKEYFGSNSIDERYLLRKSENVTVLNTLTGEENEQEEMLYTFKGWSTNRQAKAWDEGILEPGKLYSMVEIAEGAQIKQGRVELYAVWDAKPVIRATDVWMDINNLNDIDNEYIFSNFTISATDKENITEENALGEMSEGDEITVFSFRKSDAAYYANGDEDFSIQLVYQAVDRAGNVTRKPIMIHFINTNGKKKFEGARIRFISELYLSTLMDDSIWKETDNMVLLKDTLKKAKDKKTTYTYVFTPEKIKKAKEYILKNENDIKTKEKLSEFYELFCVGE